MTNNLSVNEEENVPGCTSIDPHLYKHIHYFSINFELHSNIAGETNEELNTLEIQARSMVKILAENNSFFLELYETRNSEDVL